MPIMDPGAITTAELHRLRCPMVAFDSLFFLYYHIINPYYILIPAIFKADSGFSSLLGDVVSWDGTVVFELFSTRPGTGPCHKGDQVGTRYSSRVAKMCAHLG